MDVLTKMFGKKGGTPSAQVAIQKLRTTEQMLSKKSEFIEAKIEKELAAAKKHGLKNKTGIHSMVTISAPPQEL
jgi:charged multivesicular body protein 4